MKVLGIKDVEYVAIGATLMGGIFMMMYGSQLLKEWQLSYSPINSVPMPPGLIHIIVGAVSFGIFWGYMFRLIQTNGASNE